MNISFKKYLYFEFASSEFQNLKKIDSFQITIKIGKIIKLSKILDKISTFNWNTKYQEQDCTYIDNIFIISAILIIFSTGNKKKKKKITIMGSHSPQVSGNSEYSSRKSYKRMDPFKSKCFYVISIVKL